MNLLVSLFMHAYYLPYKDPDCNKAVLLSHVAEILGVLAGNPSMDFRTQSNYWEFIFVATLPIAVVFSIISLVKNSVQRYRALKDADDIHANYSTLEKAFLCPILAL